ncbi:MAG: hypothetical protein ACR2GV_02775 [Gaiellaceae bacterium]
MSEHWPEPADEALVRRTWSSPGFDLEHDARLDDSSYANVDAFGDGRVWIDVRGRPSTDIVDWAEARARERDRGCSPVAGHRTRRYSMSSSGAGSDQSVIRTG